MRARRAGLLLGGALLLCLGTEAAAQQYRVRLDSRMQGVSWRGLAADSIPRAQAVPQADGGFLTPDGHAATCQQTYCYFFRSGDVLRGVPWVSQADLAAWGFGIRGLSIRANARLATDLGNATTWPGTEPELQLIEGYAEYAARGITARAGRQFLSSRLGAYGLDGGLATVRDADRGLELTAYLGWGLARGVALPVTDAALNPLQDFQPRDRQVVAGLDAGVTSRQVDARLEYRREVDPAVDYFVSERAAASLAMRPLPQLSITAGGEYDLAFGEVGSADIGLGWIGNGYTLSTGWRRYRPFFDLWTIWGAFSPVPHHTMHAAASVTPWRGLVLRGRGERYQFEDAGANTPTVQVEDEGWRLEYGATWSPTAAWVVDGGYHAEFGPGSSSRGFDLRATWIPAPGFWISAHGANLKRPLELRYSDADLTVLGVDAEYRPSPRWRLGAEAARWQEERDRPDAGALDWNQVRVAARLSFFFGSNADRLPLPRAVRSTTRTPP